MKWIPFVLFIMLLMPIGVGYTQVQYSLDNLTFVNATLTNTNEVIIEELDDGINENQIYYFRIRHIYSNGVSNWTYINSNTDISGEIPMSSLAVLGFVTLFTIGVFLIPRFVGQFSKVKYVDTLLKGLCISLGLFLVTLDTTIAFSIADTFNLGLGNEILVFMIITLWAGYVSIGAVILVFGYKGLMEWKISKDNKRMGYDEEL